MQKYMWDGEELDTGLYQSDDNANSHLPMYCVSERTQFPAVQRKLLWFTDLPFLLGSYHLFLAEGKVQEVYL